MKRPSRYDGLLKNIGFLLMILLAVLFVSRQTITGGGTLIAAFDSFDQSYMWMYKIYSATKSHEIALWDFNTQSGVSFIGELQTAPLYPVSIVLAIFSTDFITYFHSFILAHTLIGAYLFYLLTRRYGAGPLACVAGALLYAYSPAVIGRALGQVNIYAGLAYMPGILYALDLLFNPIEHRDRVKGVLLAALLMAFAFMSGHTHPLIVAIVVGSVLAITRVWVSNRLMAFDENSLVPEKNCSKSFQCFKSALSRNGYNANLILQLLFLLLIFLALVLPQIVATAEYMRLSYKWYGPGHTVFPHNVPLQELSRLSISIKDLKTFFIYNGLSVPGATFYFPWFVWVSILVSVVLDVMLSYKYVEYKRRLLYKIVLLSLVGLMILFAFGLVYGYIPILNNIRTPGRWGFGIALLIPILFVMALDSICKAASLGKGILFVSMIGWFMLTVTLSNSNTFFNEVIIKPPVEDNPAISAERSLQVVNLERLMSSDKMGYRFYASREHIPPNIGNKNGLMSAHGFRSSRTINYHDNFDFNPSGDVVKLLGVKYWVSEKPVIGATLLWTDGHMFISEISDIKPIFRLLNRDGEEVELPIKSINWHQNLVRLDFAKNVEGRLIFAQPFYPGFRAISNHGKSAVVKDGWVMATDIDHPAEFLILEYSPWWFYMSLLISVGTFIAVLSVLILSIFIFKAPLNIKLIK